MTADELEEFLRAARLALAPPEGAKPDMLALLMVLRDEASFFAAIVDSIRAASPEPTHPIGSVEDWRECAWGIASIDAGTHTRATVAVALTDNVAVVAATVKGLLDVGHGVVAVLDVQASEGEDEPACAHLFDAARRDDAAIALLDALGQSHGMPRGQA